MKIIKYPERDYCLNIKKCRYANYIDSQEKLMRFNKNVNKMKIFKNIDNTRENSCHSCDITNYLTYLSKSL